MSDKIQDQAKQFETNMFLRNLVKLVPVEIVALWAIISGLIPATAAAVSIWIVFGLLVILVPFYVIFAMKVKKVDQIILMTLAFPIWVFAIGGLPVLGITWFEPWMISVALALFTLIPPMFYGKRVTPSELKENVTGSTNIQETTSWRQIKA